MPFGCSPFPGPPLASDYWAPRAAQAQTGRHLFLLSFPLPNPKHKPPCLLVEIETGIKIRHEWGRGFTSARKLDLLSLFSIFRSLRSPSSTLRCCFSFWDFPPDFFGVFFVVSFQDRVASAISRRVVRAFSLRFVFVIFTRVLLPGV